MRVLVFGSLNIDYNYSVAHFVQKGETILSDDLQVFSGGKGLNQSIALARAGAEVFHAGCIGKDGHFLLDLLQESGVNTRFVKVHSEVRTGNAIIQNDSEGDNCILLYGGANQTITKSQVEEVLSNFHAGDYIVLQNEINELEYIVEKAKQIGMTIFLNPSPMNMIINKKILDSVDFLVVNEIEATQILSIPLNSLEPVKLVEEIQMKFPKMKVILTLGEEGSLYKDSKTFIQQECYKTKVVDTTAAGDTYTGYFIASLLNNKSVKESMDTASKASSVVVGKKGAAPSIPHHSQLNF